jgi:hypothetical protein
VSAETIYAPASYPKLLAILNSCLAAGGVALFAAKAYYFGVGGGVLEFKGFVEGHGYVCEVVLSAGDGVAVERQVLKISRTPN